MRHSILERNLIQSLEVAINDVTPGVQVRAYHGGKVVCDVSVGQTFPYYDFASLTKIIFSVQAMMYAFELRKWNLDTKVKEILSWYPHPSTKITELLTHTSGLEWWMPFYKDIDPNLPEAKKRELLREMLVKAPCNPGGKAIYSDLGFLTLGFVMETLFDKNLHDLWIDIKEKFYLGTSLDFNFENKPKARTSLFAPTEECPWRGRLIQGEVHDENAWALGGVSSHAGLFGTIDDLGWYALHLRSQLQGIARYFVKQKTAQLFSKRAIPVEKGDWALGYMMPSLGASSSGKYFSNESIGHTGFTGTSCWYDPQTDISILILSNRVLYGRDLKGFAQLRPEIHNLLIEGFRRSAV